MNLILIPIKNMFYVYANRLRRTRPGLSGIAQKSDARISVDWKKSNLLLIPLITIFSGFAASAMEADKDLLGLQLANASMMGSLEEVKRLVELGADVDHATSNAVTPLMWAARCGCQDIVEYFLSCGADLNAKNVQKWTALIYATRGRHAPVVAYLLERGADSSAQDINGMTAFIIASDLGDLRCCEVFVREMLRIEEMQRNARKEAFYFLCCCKKAKDENSILVRLPKDIVQIIAKGCWMKLTKTREEIRKEIACLHNEAIGWFLLDKYFPAIEKNFKLFMESL